MRMSSRSSVAPARLRTTIRVGLLLDHRRRRHPVLRLVAAVVGVDHHRAVALDHDQPQRLGQDGGQAARVADLAAGDDQAHRARTLAPVADDRGRTMAVEARRLDHIRESRTGLWTKESATVSSRFGPSGSSSPLIEELVGNARRRLPRSHRALLEQIGVQDLVVDAWPRGVQDLYATLRESRPSTQQLAGAVAVWLPQRRVVAYNGPALGPCTGRRRAHAFDTTDRDRQHRVARVRPRAQRHAVIA